MWIKRDFIDILSPSKDKAWIQKEHKNPQVKVLRGPRQVGKTSLLSQLKTHRMLLFDDHILRQRANDDPGAFLDQFTGPLVLDEATLVPTLSSEIKLRVDAAKRMIRNNEPAPIIDYWITGSNQTLLSKYVQESLAGRASFFNLNTLSLHELGTCDVQSLFLRGGWPELHAEPDQNPVRYLNSLISTFIEKDIAQAAGIEKKAAFTKTISLLAGQVGELVNNSSIASAVSVESSTVQSWVHILEQNGLVKTLLPFSNNLNKRLIKTPKIYFEDIGLAVRFQGWTEFEPLFVSPYYGHLIENLAYTEISRFFSNTGEPAKIFFVRNKEKVEVDFLVELPNQRYVAIEVKASPRDFTGDQLNLLDSLKCNIVEKWVLSLRQSSNFGPRKSLSILEVFENLLRLYNS